MITVDRLLASGFSLLSRYGVALVASLFLVACGGGGGGSSSSGSSAACNDLSLLTSGAILPGDPIEFKTQQPLGNVLLLVDDTELVLDSITSDMGYVVSAPITLDLAENGGDVELIVELDGERCPLPTVELEPLPAPSNTDSYADVLDTFEQALQRFEAAFGYDPDAVSDEDLQSDPFLLTAHYIHEIFNDPSSEISFAYQRDVLASMTEQDKAFLAQIIEKIDFITLLNALGDKFQSPLLEPVLPTPEPVVAAMVEPRVTYAQCSGTYADNSKHKVDIYNGETLSRGMKLTYEAQTKQKNAQVFAESEQAKNTMKNAVITIAGQAVKGASASAYAAVTTLWAVSNITKSMEVDMVAALLPSEITKAELTIIPKARLEEDYTEKFADPSWLFRVNARSKEYDFSKLVADTGFAALGAPNSPVDPNSLFGASEVATRVTTKAKAGDCELVVPPISWFNVTIGADYADAEFIEGNAFELLGGSQRKIKPLRIGAAELEARLKTNEFPSYTTVVENERDTIVMENLQKAFIFSSNPIVVKTAGETADVDVLIRNSVFPEKHEMQTSAELGVSKTRADKMLYLEVATPSGPEKYPQWISLKSTSKSLEPTGDRETRVQVKLEDLKIRIEETVAGSCDEKTYTEENRAVVTGFKDDDSVTWSVDGGSITELADNGVRFTSDEVGTFVLTATSNEDSSITESVTINTLDCAGNVFMNAKIISNAQTPDEECTSSNPEDTAVETHFGVIDPDYEELSPSNIRQKMGSLSEGFPFNFDQSDSEFLVFSDQQGEQCVTQTLDMVADSVGSVENQGDNTVAFGSRLDAQGHCVNEDDDGDQVTECVTASNINNYLIAWVFEHQAETSYEVALDLLCSAEPVAGLPADNNLILSIQTFDPSGQQVNVLPLGVIPTKLTTCRNGVQPDGAVWVVPEMTQGSKVLIQANFTDSVHAAPPATGEEVQEQVLTATGEVTGTIQVLVD